MSIRRAWLSPRSVLLSAVLLLPASAATLMAADAGSAADLQRLLLDWTALERQQDILENNWRQQQPLLEQRLLLLAREEEELRALLDSTAGIQDEVEGRRLELLQEQTELEREQQQLEQSLQRAVAGIERLYPQLPPPLAEAWQERLPELRDAVRSSSERLQAVVELLSSLHDFGQMLSRHESVMELEDGRRYLVQQVYLGLTQGWYLSADGSLAGHGSASAQGWQWRASEDSAAVARLLEVIDGRQPPALVNLPLTVPPP